MIVYAISCGTKHMLCADIRDRDELFNIAKNNQRAPVNIIGWCECCKCERIECVTTSSDI